MRAPEFWYPSSPHRPWQSYALSPLAMLWRFGGVLRAVAAHPTDAGVPVICVGNAVAGGAGKTPIARALCDILRMDGRNVHFVCSGYGGTLKKAWPVDPLRHSAKEVGDEALLLAANASCWMGRDRAGTIAAAAREAEIIIVDDGLQNPHFYKSLRLLVVDAASGFGNGALIPAGPLRETPQNALTRADALIIMGDGEAGEAVAEKMQQLGKVVIRARILPELEAPMIRGKRLVAFAGIGRPKKFADQVQHLGGEIAAFRAYKDHHPYNSADAAFLLALAREKNATLITTEKDAVRLPRELRNSCLILPVRAVFENLEAVKELLAPALAELQNAG
jgi:tetraacyldisaccharide 4'-kinase